MEYGVMGGSAGLELAGHRHPAFSGEKGGWVSRSFRGQDSSTRPGKRDGGGSKLCGQVCKVPESVPRHLKAVTRESFFLKFMCTCTEAPFPSS